jgi:hypothetical protein
MEQEADDNTHRNYGAGNSDYQRRTTQYIPSGHDDQRQGDYDSQIREEKEWPQKPSALILHINHPLLTGWQ